MRTLVVAQFCAAPRAVAVLMLLAVAGCGGGGGGDGGSASSTQPPSTQPPPTQPPPTQPPPQQPPPVVVAPTVSLSATPEVLAAPGNAQLVWAAQGVTSCTATGDWTGTLAMSGSRSVLADQPVNVFGVTCSGPNGNAAKSVTISLAAQGPVSARLDSDLPFVPPGGDVILSWSSRGAVACSADGAWTGARPLRGFQILGPINSRSSFTINCTGPGGTATATTDVGIVLPPSVTLKAQEENIFAGGMATLQWSAANADACVASEGWSGTKAVAGSETVGPLEQTTGFTLTCSGRGGSHTATHIMEVKPATDPFLSFGALSTEVPSGSIALLQWESARLNACQAEGAWSGSRDPSGAEPVGPLTADAVYTLRCSGPGGEYLQTVAIDVIPRVPTADDREVWLLRAEFVELQGRLHHEGYFPIASEPVLSGTTGFLSVYLSGSPQTAQFTLENDLGNPIATASLSSDENIGLPGFYFGEVALPAVRFRIVVTGLDSQGTAYQVTSRQFTPVPFALKFPRRHLEIGEGTTVNVPVLLQNFGVEQNFVIGFTGGFVNPASQLVYIGAGQTVEHVVVLTVPANAGGLPVTSIVGRIRSTVDSSLSNQATLEVAVTD